MHILINPFLMHPRKIVPSIVTQIYVHVYEIIKSK